MTKLKTISTYCVTLVVTLTATTTFASIVSVIGPPSSAGTAPAIIAAPAFAQNSTVFNTGQQGFDEMQNVLLAAPLEVDGGVFIAAGTRVSSQMIFLNKEDGVNGTLSHVDVTWTFDGMVLGVMSDFMGTLEAASTGILGAPGTTYGGPFNARGMEGADSYSVSGNTVTVSMYVTQPGDWIRVVTASVPEPTAFLVWGILGCCAAIGRRRQ